MRAVPHHHKAYVAGVKDKNQIPVPDIPHKNYMRSQRHSQQNGATERTAWLLQLPCRDAGT